MTDTTQPRANARITIPTAELAALEQAYILTKPSEVLEWLEKHPSLVALLLEASTKINNYFPDSQRFLEVVTDPEIINDAQLVIFISPKLTPNGAVHRLDQFEDDWWLDASYQTQGKLAVMVEFR